MRQVLRLLLQTNIGWSNVEQPTVADGRDTEAADVRHGNTNVDDESLQKPVQIGNVDVGTKQIMRDDEVNT